MKEQTKAVLGVLLRPRQTMVELPSNRIYALAIVSPLYFAMARAFRPPNHARLYEALGGNLQIVLVVCGIAVVMIPLGAWIMQQILKLFRKRLSVIKILNISGYAHVPRLVVAVFGYIVLLSKPSLFTGNQPSPGLIAVIVLGFAAIAYTVFLMIYGFVVSPSEAKTGANKASHATSEPAQGAASSSREG